MTTHSHLKRNPNARGSTIAWIAKRDEKLAQLRREIKESKGWKLPSIFAGIAGAFRSWRG